MAAIVLNQSDCDMVELDILKNVQFHGIIPLEVISSAENEKIHFVSKKSESYISIRQLIKQNYFNLERIRFFLECLCTCKDEMKEHLLRPSQIDLNQNRVFYDEARQTYVFMYNPCIENFDSDSERYLIQELLIHIRAFEHLEKLFQGSYCIHSLTSDLIEEKERSIFYNLYHKVVSRCRKKSSNPSKKSNTKTNNQTITLSQKGSLVSKEKHDEIFPLPFSVNSIGRASHCNVYIDSPTLSLEHAVISLIQGQYFIKDNLSKNGTFVNDKKVENYIGISSGNIIKFGEKEFIFIL